MHRPTTLVCVAAVLAGILAGAVHYSYLSTPAFGAASSRVPERTCNVGASQPKVVAAAPLATTDWFSKPFDYIEQKFGEWRRTARAVVVGVIVAAVVFVVGAALVGLGLIGATLLAVAALALVAGIVAGLVDYALNKPAKNRGSENGPPPPSPLPPPPPSPPAHVFLQLRWERSDNASEQAKQLLVWLSWRSKSNNNQPRTEQVWGKDMQQWQAELEKQLSKIKGDLSDDELKKNRVKLDTLPDPGPGTLATARGLIRQVFGKQVTIEEGSPEENKAKNQKSN